MRERRGICLLFVTLILLSVCAARKTEEAEAPVSETLPQTTENEESYVPETVSEENRMILTINGKDFDVQWENNEAVKELSALAAESPVTVSTTIYGGFEQVGSLPQSLSRDDVQITAEPGDIVLYSGDRLVIFFGSNSWSYTKLGHINLSADELKDLLGSDRAAIEIKINR